MSSQIIFYHFQSFLEQNHNKIFNGNKINLILHDHKTRGKSLIAKHMQNKGCSSIHTSENLNFEKKESYFLGAFDYDHSEYDHISIIKLASNTIGKISKIYPDAIFWIFLKLEEGEFFNAFDFECNHDCNYWVIRDNEIFPESTDC